MFHTSQQQDKRKDARYDDFARALMPELTAFHAVLIDVSETGCRVKFSSHIEIDYERTYTLQIEPACRDGILPFALEVQAVWSMITDGEVETGFAITFMPDEPQFKKYLALLKQNALDSDELFLQEICQ